MSRNVYTALTIFLFLVIIPFNTVHSQYSPNTALNYAICDTAGEQALTKNAPTSDGGVYVTWFDTRSGSYALYLQKLDAAGNKLFASNGLLISNNPQSSSLVDYDLKVDAQNNAIIAFTDIRNGSSINPFVYKISPTGQFLWGANGVTLADTTTTYQANPKIVCTSDGNYFVIWFYGSSPKRIAMQKLNSLGVKQFTPTAIYVKSSTTNENYDWPWPVVSDNGSIILMWAGYTGTFISPGNYKLYSQKYSSTGQPLWGASPTMVYSLGRVSGFYTPFVASDGNNGAVYCWQDDRNSTNITNSYVQRQRADGTFMFPVNGSIAATNTSDVLRFAPSATVNASTNETFVYWQQKNGLQSMIGLYGQKYDSTGTAKWDAANGLPFKPMDGNSFSSLSSFSKEGKAYVFYLESTTTGTSFVKGFSNDGAGAMQWQGGIVTLSSYASSKIRNWSSMTTNGMFVCTWEDERNDGGGIYAQNIYFDGSVPVELLEFNSIVNGSGVTLNWSTATELNNKGFAVERKCENDEWTEVGFIPGAGTSTIKHNYVFNDERVKEGSYKYRLCQIDFDGKRDYSKEINVEVSLVPGELELLQNYPNPFNPATIIRYKVAAAGNVVLKVYNALGSEVVELINEVKEPGSYEVKFDAIRLASGVYIYELRSGNQRIERKMLLIK